MNETRGGQIWFGYLLLLGAGIALAGCCTHPWSVAKGEARFVKRVVVKFKPGVFPDDGSRYQFAAEQFLDESCRTNPDIGAQQYRQEQKQPPASCRQAWQNLSREFGRVSLNPSFVSLKPADLRRLVEQARQNNPNYSDPHFFRYFYVSRPPGSQDANRLAAEIRKLPFVEAVYVDTAARPAGLVTKEGSTSGYVDNAPAGLGINSFGWNRADGTGLRLAVIDRGWLLAPHSDLPSLPVPLAGHAALSESVERWHGTAVIGVVSARQSAPSAADPGIVGVAPKASLILASPIAGFDEEGYPVDNAENAITAAANVLQAGDILVIPLQTYSEQADHYVPMEQKAAVFEAIYAATSKGIIVIQAAGNFREDGSAVALNNLDASFPIVVNGVSQNLPILIEGIVQGKAGRSLKPGGPDYLDSLSIIVGAAKSPATPSKAHERLPTVNSGSWIRTYAWGEGIVSSGTNTPATAEGPLYSGLGKTSGASAIIAGTALLIQGMSPTKLTPLQMRSVLQDPAKGTAVIDSASSPSVVGSMPDLSKF